MGKKKTPPNKYVVFWATNNGKEGRNQKPPSLSYATISGEREIRDEILSLTNVITYEERYPSNNITLGNETQEGMEGRKPEP